MDKAKQKSKMGQFKSFTIFPVARENFHSKPLAPRFDLFIICNGNYQCNWEFRDPKLTSNLLGPKTFDRPTMDNFQEFHKNSLV